MSRTQIDWGVAFFALACLSLAAAEPTEIEKQQRQQMLQGSPVWTGETAGPKHIDVEMFDGFGPLDPTWGD